MKTDLITGGFRNGSYLHRKQIFPFFASPNFLLPGRGSGVNVSIWVQGKQQIFFYHNVCSATPNNNLLFFPGKQEAPNVVLLSRNPGTSILLWRWGGRRTHGTKDVMLTLGGKDSATYSYLERDKRDVSSDACGLTEDDGRGGRDLHVSETSVYTLASHISRQFFRQQQQRYRSASRHSAIAVNYVMQSGHWYESYSAYVNKQRQAKRMNE